MINSDSNYLYPIIKEKSKLSSGFIQIVFDVEGVQVRVERSSFDKQVMIYLNGIRVTSMGTDWSVSESFNTTKEDKTKFYLSYEDNVSYISFKEHDIVIKNVEGPSFPFNLLGLDDGVRIFVDKKPLEGSLLDLNRRIQKSKIALASLVGVSLVKALLTGNILAGINAIIFIILFLTTRKAPILTLLIGSLLALVEVFSGFISGTTSNYHAVFMVFEIGLFVIIIRGFFAAIKLSVLKRKNVNIAS